MWSHRCIQALPELMLGFEGLKEKDSMFMRALVLFRRNSSESESINPGCRGSELEHLRRKAAYFGQIKSYNPLKGFGFISCEACT